LAQTNSSVELQKLKVVPQTVFVGARPSESSSRTSLSRRLNTEGHGRGAAVYGSPRISRAGSIEHINHFDDLRRRLAVMNGSSSSLTHAPDGERRASSSTTRPSTVTSPIGQDPPHGAEPRSSSPTDSVVSSAVDGSSLRPRHLHVGSTDNQKAPAAVGSVRANAVGLLEAPIVSRLGEDDLITSGRSSPVSIAGTLRADYRSSLHSARPYSVTFGALHTGSESIDFMLIRFDRTPRPGYQ
jgi:phosphoinositide-3-kinase, regulatory subunit 4